MPYRIYHYQHTYTFDLVVAFVARGRDESLETVLAVQLSLLLDEADILKGTTALRVYANKVIGTPDLA